MRTRPILLFTFLTFLSCGTSPAVPAKSHAILIVIDTLRKDAADRAYTPVLDDLGKQGTAVERAWSAGTWTVPSVISLFSGMSVREHAWNYPSGNLDHLAAVPEVPLIAEVLQKNGFRTTGLFANVYLQAEFGFARGFEVWRHLPDRAMAGGLRQEMATWIKEDRRFLYIHLMGPHSPLRPSPESAERWNFDLGWSSGQGLTAGAAKRGTEPGVREAYRAGYHAVIEDTDLILGELLGMLEPYLEDAVLIVTSDHGEMLGEHGGKFAHGPAVWETLTHVPLVALGAAPLPETLGIASVPDIITSALQVEYDWPTPGNKALPLVSIREGWYAMLTGNNLKGIWDPQGVLSVFDLEADRLEQIPLLDADSHLMSAREQWESVIIPKEPSSETIPVDADTRERLESLGYIGN